MPKIFPYEPGDIVKHDKRGRGIVINLLGSTLDDVEKMRYRIYFYKSQTYSYEPNIRLVQKATPETKDEANLLHQQSIGYFGSKNRYNFGDIIMDPIENMAQVIILDNGRRNMTNNHVYYHIYIIDKDRFEYRSYRKKINNICTKSNDATRKQARALLFQHEFKPAFS